MKHLRTALLSVLLALMLALPAMAESAAPAEPAPAVDPLQLLLPALLIAALCGFLGFKILRKRFH